MAAARDLTADYGGPYVDDHPVENEETELAADRANRVMEDTAQMTRTSTKVRFCFTTRTSNGNATVTVIRTQWGSETTHKPTVARTAQGLYTCTFATDFTDALDVEETVSFVDADASVRSTDTGADGQDDDLSARVLTIAANVITLKVESPAGTLADLGNFSADAMTVSVTAAS